MIQMNATQIVNRIDNALHLLDPLTKAVLSSKLGIAYEVFVETFVGNVLVRRYGWTWEHPNGLATFSTSNGGKLSNQLSSYSHVRAPNGLCLIQAVSAEGQSGISHQLDIALADSEFESDLTWKGVRTVIECKNVNSLLSLPTARDFIGLAAEMKLGRHNRLWRAGNYRTGLLIAANQISGPAKDLLDYWKLVPLDCASPVASQSGRWVLGVARKIYLQAW